MRSAASPGISLATSVRFVASPTSFPRAARRFTSRKAVLTQPGQGEEGFVQNAAQLRRVGQPYVHFFSVNRIGCAFLKRSIERNNVPPSKESVRCVIALRGLVRGKYEFAKRKKFET